MKIKIKSEYLIALYWAFGIGIAVGAIVYCSTMVGVNMGEDRQAKLDSMNFAHTLKVLQAEREPVKPPTK